MTFTTLLQLTNDANSHAKKHLKD